ncbi:efflux RND transporter permease subunit [Candidatus Phycosocius spiralis]|uniref:Multidrug transporter n=1 Tax=Candidatus Phycosocius spiralis TaxID=2815099 RepID=A0ABQ4PSQ1_9PROT|nr:efflux RND transporter permease subunit [Candidatus Phycosocius spiralis]GIU66032.1 multidrug transporter [Candidatus Phycosocius spiralis]
MFIADISVKRPVLATVASLLLMAFGLIAFKTLPLRELPAVDPPIVSVTTQYRGASSDIIESRITQIIEDQLTGIEGLASIQASSRDGRSSIRVEFKLSRSLDEAANDVRAAVSRIQNRLPSGVDPPQVEKSDADSDPIMFLNLASTKLSTADLTNFTEQNLVDRFSAIDGVASVRVFGGLRQSMRVWLDTEALAARGLTPDDVDTALRSQNVELPAGQIEGQARDYAMRIARGYRTAEEFRRMPLGRSGDGRLTRLEDVARVAIEPEEDRRLFRGNGVNQVGMGIVRQSNANALDVARAVRAQRDLIAKTLPMGTTMVVAFDSTVFIERAVQGVWTTMAEAIVLVIVVIYLFLGSFRAAFLPAATIPVCLIATFGVLGIFGFSINLITLLALVLAIGLVVDDAIVVLENIQRRVDAGEPALIAAQRGTNQVAFAVIATTAVLVSVFTPLLFTGGFVGRLFVELAVTIASAVSISAFVALTLTPMMCSLLLRPANKANPLTTWINRGFEKVQESYTASVKASLRARRFVMIVMAVIFGAVLFFATKLPSELVPLEDRGNITINISAPEGAGFSYTQTMIAKAEPIMADYVRRGEAVRTLFIAPSFQDQGTGRMNRAIGRVFLSEWGKRREGNDLVDELNKKLASIPGAQFRVSMQNAFSSGRGAGNDGVAIVLGGSNYKDLAAIGEKILAKGRFNEGFARIRMNYEPTSPKIEVSIDRERAAALGVSVQSIGRTLEATTGLRRVGTYPANGDEYDVILQVDRRERKQVEDLDRIYVRSDRTGELVALSNLVTTTHLGGTDDLPRVNKLRAITISANLNKGYTIGQAVQWLEEAAAAEMKPDMKIDYTGQSQQFKEAGSAIGFAFILAILIVFLTLAAQFESFVHPLTIMITVPLAMAGGLFGLYAAGFTLNIYSQIGLIILVALAAKNGILMVEFANQLRDEGARVQDAILEASALRLRPILMTSVATIAGALPLALSHGAGAEARSNIGVVVVFGVLCSTILTLFIVPPIYMTLARFTGSPLARAKAIEEFERQELAAQLDKSN